MHFIPLLLSMILKLYFPNITGGTALGFLAAAQGAPLTPGAGLGAGPVPPVGEDEGQQCVLSGCRVP